MQIPEGYILIKQEEYDKLKESIRDLSEKLAKLSKTSINSSKPPSSDLVKRADKKDKKTKGKIGGQPGHPKHGRNLFLEDDVDNEYEYNLSECPVCHRLVDIDISKPPRIIQQVEIINSPVQIEEHKAYAYWCNHCQQYHYADFPGYVVKAGLFKARLTALVAYMKHVCHCSFSTIRKYIRDVLQLKVSRGYLAKIIAKVSNSLEPSYQELLERLPLSTKANVDETGHKENGDKFWTWVFRADLFVLFKIDKSRGSEVLKEVLGEEFNGVLGCDYFSAYRKYMKDFNVTVQFCIAHLIRDIKFLSTYPDQQIREYGKSLLDKVRELFKVIHQQDSLTENEFVDQLSRIKNQIIETAIFSAPSEIGKDGKELKKPAQNMAKRFHKHGQAYFEFITNPDIDPTNNIAEQAIRFIVIDRHVTQGTRSITGRTACERIWTVIATCALQGKSAFDFILRSVEADFYATQFPSLLYNSS